MKRLFAALLLSLSSLTVAGLSGHPIPAFACVPDGYGGCIVNVHASCPAFTQTFTVYTGLGDVESAGYPAPRAGYSVVNSDDSPLPPASYVSVRNSMIHNGVYGYYYLTESGSGGYSC